MEKGVLNVSKVIMPKAEGGRQANIQGGDHRGHASPSLPILNLSYYLPVSFRKVRHDCMTPLLFRVWIRAWRTHKQASVLGLISA